MSPGAQMSRPPRSWAWREICWGQKPPQSYYVPGWRGGPRSRRSRHPHQAKSLCQDTPRGHPESWQAAAHAHKLPKLQTALWDPRVSPEQPQGPAPHYSSPPVPGAPLSPFRTHPEGHPQQLASFSGTATELSELRRPPALEVGGRCPTSPHVSPSPREAPSSLPPGHLPGPGRASARGGAPTGASRRRVTGEGAEERGASRRAAPFWAPPPAPRAHLSSAGLWSLPAARGRAGRGRRCGDAAAGAGSQRQPLPRKWGGPGQAAGASAPDAGGVWGPDILPTPMGLPAGGRPVLFPFLSWNQGLLAAWGQ